MPCLPFTRPLLLAATLSSFVGASALACGPDFPNAYLANSLQELSTLPTLSFERELTRLLAAPRSPIEATETKAKRLAAAEREDVRFALRQAGWATSAIESALTNYRRDAPPERSPREFRLYAQGAKAWHEGRTDDALAAWEELLRLPEAERQFRTVWAAYMIGRATCDAAPERALAAFALARTARGHGFVDSQELADACLGWEARARLRQKDYVAAVRLYFQQFSQGDPTAVTSLQWTLQRAFRGQDLDASGESTGQAAVEGIACDDLLGDLARDSQLRGIVTAWFTARGGPFVPWSAEASQAFVRWLHALPEGKLSPAEADRWCWAAYQNGCWSEASALAAQAPATASAAEWVRAMLLLRAGFIDDAATHLAVAARGFGTDFALANGEDPRDATTQIEQQPLGAAPAAQLAGVRGVLALRREQYTEALRVFLRAGHWADAAYVAERVLTLDELICFVAAEDGDRGCFSPATHWRDAPSLRHLLARRLVRAKRFDEAEAYFPAAVRPIYRDYFQAVRIGWDANQPAKRRADALWSAAQVMRERGMKLAGTELEPDYAIWDGGFSWPELATLRGPSAIDGARSDRRPSLAPLEPTAQELSRLASAAVPKKRYSYRYRAAELAWLAASLLPNDDEQTAVVLHTAGKWLAGRDPEYAQSFYQSLVFRCPHTELGAEAKTAHWFAQN